MTENNSHTDLVWENDRPISLDFQEASRVVFNNVITELPEATNINILRLRIVNGFDVLLPYNIRYKDPGIVTKCQFLWSVYYFPYKLFSGNNFLDMGKVCIPIIPNINQPIYAFTGSMNGCAIIITKKENENSFTAWHFPSPGSSKYRNLIHRFIKDYRDQIYSYLCFDDYAMRNDGNEYNRDDVEGFNYLYFNRNNDINAWELRSIPLRRIHNNSSGPNPPSNVWNTQLVEFSPKPRSIRRLNFSSPISIPPANEDIVYTRPSGDTFVSNPVIEWMADHITYPSDIPEDERPTLPESPLPGILPPQVVFDNNII